MVYKVVVMILLLWMSDLHLFVCAKEECGRLVKKVIDVVMITVSDRTVITAVVADVVVIGFLLFSFFSVSNIIDCFQLLLIFSSI